MSVKNLPQYKAKNMIIKSRTVRICIVLFIIATGFCNGKSSEKSLATDNNPGDLSLERIFTSEEFKVENFGPVRNQRAALSNMILETDFLSQTFLDSAIVDEFGGADVE